MVIHKIKSEEVIGYQQIQMVVDCEYLLKLNDSNFSYYHYIMNMKTRRWNDEHHYSVAVTYYFNLNKW